ncbi:hypothetical protein HDU76_011942, partial [Blyttiomyces sp. JEL0837]
MSIPNRKIINPATFALISSSETARKVADPAVSSGSPSSSSFSSEYKGARILNLGSSIALSQAAHSYSSDHGFKTSTTTLAGSDSTTTDPLLLKEKLTKLQLAAYSANLLKPPEITFEPLAENRHGLGPFDGDHDRYGQ